MPLTTFWLPRGEPDECQKLPVFIWMLVTILCMYDGALTSELNSQEFFPTAMGTSNLSGVAPFPGTLNSWAILQSIWQLHRIVKRTGHLKKLEGFQTTSSMAQAHLNSWKFSWAELWVVRPSPPAPQRHLCMQFHGYFSLSLFASWRDFLYYHKQTKC